MAKIIHKPKIMREKWGNDDTNSVKLRTLSDRQQGILETMRINLTAKKALIYLKDYEFDMSIRTYHREKAKLKKMQLKRFFALAQVGFEKIHMDVYDELITARKLLWKAHNETKNPLHRVMILEKIINVLPYLTSFYESTRQLIENRPEFKENGNLA
jgi:hypothetical protein